ncbi:hypothetical protein A3Q56_06959, partial [Intoshia linei]
MRTICSEKKVIIPDEVELTISKRVVQVKGPKGRLIRSFRHLTIFLERPSKGVVIVRKYFGMKKDLAAVKTIASHIENMINGVLRGYEVRMKIAFAHFPITLVLTGKDRCHVEIKNYLGSHESMKFLLPRHVECKHDEETNNEIILSGTNIELVTGA